MSFVACRQHSFLGRGRAVTRTASYSDGMTAEDAVRQRLMGDLAAKRGS